MKDRPHLKISSSMWWILSDIFLSAPVVARLLTGSLFRCKVYSRGSLAAKRHVSSLFNWKQECEKTRLLSTVCFMSETSQLSLWSYHHRRTRYGGDTRRLLHIWLQLFPNRHVCEHGIVGEWTFRVLHVAGVRRNFNGEQIGKRVLIFGHVTSLRDAFFYNKILCFPCFFNMFFKMQKKVQIWRNGTVIYKERRRRVHERPAVDRSMMNLRMRLKTYSNSLITNIMAL